MSKPLTDLGGDLRKLIDGHYGIMSINAVSRIFNSDPLSKPLRRSLGIALKKRHPNSKTTSEEVDKLVTYVRDSAQKLYAILLLINKSDRIVELYKSSPPVDDSIFEHFDENGYGPCCTMKWLVDSPLKQYAKTFYETQWDIPPVLSGDEHRMYPPEYFRFPFKGKPTEYKYGAYGVVGKVHIADGHLVAPKYKPGSFVAHKAVRGQGYNSVPKDPHERREKLMKLRNEVNTLRARQHDNIVPLLASFSAGYAEPQNLSVVEELLHMLFPYSEVGDMKQWLIRPPHLNRRRSSPPHTEAGDMEAWIQSPLNHLSDSPTRHAFIYGTMQDLASGLAYIHREINGKVGFHHDLKPSNILLFLEVVAGQVCPVWKISDFGFANLKDPQDGTGTDVKCGTSEYIPPEYFDGNDVGNEQKHGRSHDVWSLGCIFLELATVCKYGWSDNGLLEFKKLRGENTQREYVTSRLDDKDISFHNNLKVVNSWIKRLKKDSMRGDFVKVLNLISSMLAKDPKQRVFAWEVYMDLYAMCHEYDDDLEERLKDVVQKSRQSLNKLNNQHNPLQRAEDNERPHWWIAILKKNDWSNGNPKSTHELTQREKPVKHYYSTLDSFGLGCDFETNRFFGRHAIDDQIREGFKSSNCVGLYGISGVGKSHLAYRFIVRYRDTALPKGKKHTFWVDARSGKDFLDSFDRMAKKLKINVGLDDPAGLIVSVNRWLEKGENGAWIMVIDGIDQETTAKDLRNKLPQNCGQILVTTKDRATLDHFLPLRSVDLYFHVDGLEREDCPYGLKIDDCRSIFNWHMRKDLIGEETTYMDDLFRTLSLPKPIISLAKYLTKFNIHAKRMYGDLVEGNRDTVGNALLPFYLGLFEPLITNTQISQGNWPSEELKLLGELSCLSLLGIPRHMVEQVYNDHPRLPEMLGVLENCSLLRKGTDGKYYMSEIVQKAVQVWIKEKMVPSAMLELHDSALTMMFCYYRHKQNTVEAGGSPYHWKLKFLPHFERFLNFARECNDQLKYDVSELMARAVVVFSHVYLDEGRYDDAIIVLRTTHRHYRGTSFFIRVGHTLAKAYLLRAQGRQPDQYGADLQSAETLLVELWGLVENSNPMERQRWWIVLSLADMYSQSERPQDAWIYLKRLPDLELRNPEDETAKRLVVSKMIEEAKAYFAEAKQLNSHQDHATHDNKLNSALSSLRSAEAAISTWLNREADWLAEINEKIADVFTEIGTREALNRAELILTVRLNGFDRDAEETDHSRRDKGMWDIRCKIARIWIRQGTDLSLKDAIKCLEELLGRYENRYGGTHGHTRICASLLKEAYDRMNEGQTTSLEGPSPLNNSHTDNTGISASAQITRKSLQSESCDLSLFGGTALNSNVSGETLVALTVLERKDDEPRVDEAASLARDYSDTRSLISEEDNEHYKTYEGQLTTEFETAVVHILATNHLLAPLYEKGLQLMPKDRFINNYRRLLKIFHTGIATLPATTVTHELKALLRSKVNRQRIVEKIIKDNLSNQHPKSEDLSNEDESQEQEKLRHERDIARWLDKTTGTRPDNDERDDNPETNDANKDDDKGDNVMDDYADLLKDKQHFLNDRIDASPTISTPLAHHQVIQALIESPPFQDLFVGLKAFLLPNRLLEDILTIPHEHITFDPCSKSVLVNTVQGWLEDITELEWDWWPLSPRMRPLRKGETRVFWRCVCGTTRWRVLKQTQKEILEDLLKTHPARKEITRDLPDQHSATLPRRPLCSSLKSCQNLRAMYHTQHPSSTSRSEGQAPSAPDSQGRTLSSTSSTPMSSGQPSNNPRSGVSPEEAQVPPNTTNSALNSTPQLEPLWLVFGVSGSRVTVELDQFDKHTLASDPIFLRKLQQRHDELRGSLRLYFTFWKLSYWEFVKFRRRHTRYFFHKNELPETPEYEYAPRPPSDPGIDKHGFERLVRACITPCWLSSIHDCYCISDNCNELVECLPKRKRKFKFDPPDSDDGFFWGLEARYVVSAIRVVFIHVLAFAIPFGVWGWWQRNHPEDLQGASVAFTVTGLLVSIFWSSTGILKMFNQGSGSLNFQYTHVYVG